MGQKSKRVTTVTTQCPCISREKNQKYLGTFIHKNLGNIDHFVTYQHIWIWGMTYWFEAWLDYAGFVRTYPFQLQRYGKFHGEQEVFSGENARKFSITQVCNGLPSWTTCFFAFWNPLTYVFPIDLYSFLPSNFQLTTWPVHVWFHDPLVPSSHDIHSWSDGCTLKDSESQKMRFPGR